MGTTVGIHWIATTHGSWLHGDPRGSWRDGVLIGPDPLLHDRSLQSMTHGAVILNDAEIGLVAEAFGDVVRERRLIAYAATVQRTHAHLVLAPTALDVKTIVAQLKRRSASRVLGERRRRGVPTPRSLWTAGPFVRFLFDREHLVNAVDYARRHDTGSDGWVEPYDWVTSLPS
jgi:REP element-mobilizing transposase RayT